MKSVRSDSMNEIHAYAATFPSDLETSHPCLRFSPVTKRLGLESVGPIQLSHHLILRLVVPPDSLACCPTHAHRPYPFHSTPQHSHCTLPHEHCKSLSYYLSEQGFDVVNNLLSLLLKLSQTIPGVMIVLVDGTVAFKPVAYV